MKVWVAAPAEAVHVARLLGEFRTRFHGRHEPDDESLLASVERLFDDPATEYLLAAVDSEPAGVAQLRYRYGLWYGADDCWLEDLYVSEDARGAGLGSALMEAVIGRARERGCARVELDTTEDNTAALSLYERFGFARGVFMRRFLR